MKARRIGRRTGAGTDGICRNVDGKDTQVGAHIPLGDIGNFNYLMFCLLDSVEYFVFVVSLTTTAVA